jgi:hypothetical protein
MPNKKVPNPHPLLGVLLGQGAQSRTTCHELLGGAVVHTLRAWQHGNTQLAGFEGGTRQAKRLKLIPPASK